MAESAARLRIGQLLRLSGRDLWHERWLALCTACVLAATLAPLWTEWGLSRGVVGTLIDRLERDPINRRVRPFATGTGRFDEAWFADVRTWPGVVFAIPMIRLNSASVMMVGASSPQVMSVALQATAAGDPLLEDVPQPMGNSIVLTRDAARKLGVTAGQPLRIALSRRNGGETLSVDAVVGTVLTRTTSEDDGGFASLDFLTRIEDWREGHDVPELNATGSAPPRLREVYPLFRIHTASIRDVAEVARRLEAQRISPNTNASAIEDALSLQRNLRAVMAMVGGVAVTGAAMALAALQVATVRRKRREYALLKLTGHGRSWLVVMPCVNALAVALVGGLLALGAYSIGAAAINAYFASSFAVDEAAVRLEPIDVLGGFAGAILISVVPSLWAGWRASNLEAADELREN